MSMKNTLPWGQEVKRFFQVWDERFEEYDKHDKSDKWKYLLRDFIASVVVALVSIPLGIGFAIASGMRPEQGIVAGAIAGLLGGIFGGSKFQVYGATAAFIPIISPIVRQFDVPFLILAAIIAGVVVSSLGLLRLGKYFNLVPHSIIVGFTIGIALTIGMTQVPSILGETSGDSGTFVGMIKQIPQMFAQAHAHALVLAIFTFIIVKHLNKISVYIPAALIAMVLCTLTANQVWHDKLIPLVSTQYGEIARNLFAFTPPSLGVYKLTDLILPVINITFIAALESLLSSRMADRLAGNRTPYNANKELFGQGIANIVAPLMNGLPVTGALARTATNIKCGAVSPAASIFAGATIIFLMIFCAGYLGLVPMAFVGGLLVYVATNMVKKEEVDLVLRSGKMDTLFMLYTAGMTVLTNLSLAVVSATALYYVMRLVVKRKPSREAELANETLENLKRAAQESTSKHAVLPDDCPSCGHQLVQADAYRREKRAS